ncbi:MAG: hypothetical protein J7619_19550 [Dyadobacter sp.]|uniref:hypothetical protein n=1 Tax=Dyadobacter sp. TaxID=1914288 RepID=UPI001B099FA3|nr:hypothetical protein [Dyadobacter sp.]MBO9614908.1 hypothetical protein [Dyadobacter sp.]
MKSLLRILAIISLVHIAEAQSINKWELGVSGFTGRDFYDRKYYDQPERPPGRQSKLKSNYLWASGLWVEKRLNPRLVGLAELRYTEVDVPNNTFCECSHTGSAWLQDEKHYWSSLGIGLRHYLNPKSQIALFFDGKADADWLIASKEKISDRNYIHWDAMGYSRFALKLSLSVGAKWKRLAISFGGNTHAARTIVRDVGIHNKVHYAIKTGILSRGFFVKAAFTAVKFR